LNTDSCFLSIKFNRNNFELNRKDAFNLAIVCGDNLTKDIFKRPPIELEFEKVYQPFILLTKKRYIGKKFEDTKDPLKLKTLTTAGIALTRRDYCQMVKKCYKEIIDKVMEGNESSVSDSLDIFKNYINKIETYNIDFDELVISAMLAKNYSCSLCKEKTEWNMLKCGTSSCKENNVTKRSEYCLKCKAKFKCIHVFSLAHVNLAVTLLKRTEEINVNDRIQYLYVEPTEYKKDAKKADLAEDPKYAKEHGLKFNRVCYLEQLAKPILGFYKIVLKEDENLLDDIINVVNGKLVEFGGKKLKPSDFKIEDD
jgi:DNA polymerase delta subunit 1